jgi:uncharacterized membrane protein
MNKNERWLSSISMTVSLLPLVLVALSQSVLKPPYKFIDITTGEIHILDASALIFAASFCLIPFIIVFVARLLRRGGLIMSNLIVVSIAMLVLSVVYISAMLYIIYANIKGTSIDWVIKKMDYMSLTCTVVSGIFALLANFLPDLQPNPFFGVKNKKTMENHEVWKTVNGSAGIALTHIFLFTSVFTAFARGALAIVIFICAISFYYAWVYLYSTVIYKKLTKDKE